VTPLKLALPTTMRGLVIPSAQSSCVGGSTSTAPVTSASGWALTS
jgi:hypothetical protein